MIERLDRAMDQRGAIAVGALAVAGMLLVGVVDTVTGYELSLSVFYLGPIALAAWYGNGRIGALLCVLSAVTWFVADHQAGRSYSIALIPFWNALVRLGFFTITAALLRSVRSHLAVERRLARTDNLTGLFNARAFREISQRQLELARRHRRPIALAYFDLDNFKTINDELGHAGGDRVLQRVGQVLSARLRESDAAGRMGGDEFAVLLPDTGSEGAERLFDEIHRQLLGEFRKERWPTGASVGVIVFADEPPELEEAIRLADGLMYEVKRTGKNSMLVRKAEPVPATG